MKDYEKMAHDVLRRIDAYETAKARKKKTVTRAMTGVLCMGLVALLGIGVWQSSMFIQDGVPMQEKPVTNYPSSIPNTVITTGVTTTLTQDPSSDKLLFDVNQISEIVLGAKRKFPEGSYEEKWDTAKMSRHLGIDLQNLGDTIYDELKEETIQSHSVIFAEDGTMLYDIARIRFVGTEGQNVTVMASKLSTPYDCLYKLESERKTRIRLRDSGEILSVLVAAQTDASGQCELCVADFEYKGVNYRITAENAPVISIERLIREIAE